MNSELSPGLSPLHCQSWAVPVPIEYGPGSRAKIVELCRRFSIARPLLVVDRGSVNLPFVANLRNCLCEAGLPCEIYSGIEPNPTDSAVKAGVGAYRDWQADGIVALGGGSALDGGKALALIAAQQRCNLWDFDFDRPTPTGFGREAFPPLITIPTTAGTGAETDSTAMITDTTRGVKGCVWHPHARPSAVILDPELTQTLPAHLTAWTGCDAIVHALEAYFVPRFNPLCDGLALQALSMLWASVGTAVTHGQDLATRGRMLVGSCLAGVAFLKGLGLVHALSHTVGATYDTHHGLTNAVILPVVLRFNEPDIAARLNPVAHAMNLPDPTFATFYQAICSKLDELEIPKSLAAIGVDDRNTQIMARKSFADPAHDTNPRASTVEQLSDLLAQAITRSRT